MTSYLNPWSTASFGATIKDPDARGGLRERDRIVGGVHRLLSGGVAQDYTGVLRRWALRWTGLTNTQWTTVKAYIQSGHQLYWQGPEMAAKVGVIVEDAEQDQVHLNGDSAAAPHWNVSMTLREGTQANTLLAGLASYWKLDETSGTRFDSVTFNANDLTAVNTPGSTTGKVGNAATFTAASTQYLNCASNTVLQTGDIDFTVCAWAYITSKASNRDIVTKYTTTGNQREWEIVYNSTADRFRFVVSPNGTTNVTQDANTLGSPSLSTWYFVVCWHDSVANTINIQVNNGTPDSFSWSGGVFASSSQFCIGALGNPTQYFDGRIDEVGYWKRVLTAAERTALYNSGSGRTYPF